MSTPVDPAQSNGGASHKLPEPPEWLILEGAWYRHSAEGPAAPPWTHVDRAGHRGRWHGDEDGSDQAVLDYGC